MEIVSTYYIENGNTGDLASWPGQYFPFPSRTMDVWEGHKWDGNDHLIIGGGGVYGRDDKEWGVFTAKGKGKKIVWGVGHNKHSYDFDGYPEWFKDCDLIGVRDFPLTETMWLPDASCMHSVFDEDIQVTRDVMVYDHWEFPTGVKDYFTMKNKTEKMEDVVREMKASALVVTSTYHGMYWAILAGCRCLVVPFSSKFHFSRFDVTLTTTDDWWKDARKSRAFPEALEMCREKNKEFYKKVLKLIGG